MSAQSGSQILPKSTENSKTFTLSFPIPYLSKNPQVTASVQGRAGTYAVGGVVSSSLSFRFTAIRTDLLGGWTEQPSLLWSGVGLEVPPPLGNQAVGSSPTNTTNVSVKFSSPEDPPLKEIFAWVIGDFFSQMTYAVQMNSINSGGFQCTVCRTDATSGWDENPTLFWSVIQQ
ncbi:unnamed protein product [Clavelina lepadiformis]|uniref:Uncharacterized protein n=1 Tax=Clavelina lepadiformis TaxID=159417 RepID=A0ABP0F0M7_CLALP